MKAYKGFNPDMTCRKFQYEEGEEYETETAKLCESGFHACECPLSVFNYYAPCNDKGELNKFHEVELEDVSDEKGDDTKVVAKKIKIGAELNFFGLAKAHVEWVKSKIDKEKTEENTGEYSVATNTGERSAATSTGFQSVATNTGFQSVATNTGGRSAATSTGFQSVATNTGFQSVATNTGEYSVATNTGERSAATNTGGRSAATNTGFQSVATNTGGRSAATNTGEYSVATNTGERSAATNTGAGSIAVAWGIEGKAKASLGSYIVVAEWGFDKKSGKRILLCAKMAQVDGKQVKANTFYMLKNGKLVEVEE